jgi:large subunit ribosomal protein L4
VSTLKKYDLTGQEIGEVQVEETFLDTEVNSQSLKDYIVAIRANARQWSANTKGRSEVACSTKKPHAQKGTGKARQGSLASPQYRGGGIVFGPKPKFNQHVRINRKERKKVVQALISEKIKNNKVYILQDDALDVPKTKVVANFLKKLELQKRVLFVGEGSQVTISGENNQIDVRSREHANLARSVRNLQKVNFSLAKNVNGYNLMLAQDLVLTEKALQEIIDWVTAK